jgi:O-antigen/teichoic acid export membrane protein
MINNGHKHPSSEDQVSAVAESSLHSESSLAMFFAAGRSSFVLLASRGVNMLSQFFLILIISRSMGRQGLGVFSFVLSTTILASFISNFGLDTLVTREIASQPARGRALVSQVLGLKLCSSLAAYFLVNLVFFFTPLDPSIQRDLAIYSLSIFFSSLSQLLWFYGDAFDRFSLHGVLWASTHILRTVVAASILMRGGSLGSAFLGLVAAEAVALLISWVAINRSLGPLRISASLAEWKVALQKAYVIAVYGLLGALGFRIDVVILQMLRGEHEVGIYSAAFKLVEVMHVLPSSLSLVYFPRFSRTFNTGGIRLTVKLLLRLLVVTMACGIVLSTLLYSVAPHVVQLFYGETFLASTFPLRILVFKIFLMFANLPISYALIAIGEERQATLWAAISAAANILANYLLVPIYGSAGSAVASVLAEALFFFGPAGRILWLFRAGSAHPRV